MDPPQETPMALKKTDAKLEADSAAVLSYLREGANEGEDTSSEIAAVTVLPNGRQALPATRSWGAPIPQSFRANWEAAD